VLSGGGAAHYPQLQVGPPLGVNLPGPAPTRWPGTRLPLPAGASVLLYTDGLLDAYSIDPESDSLGIDELVVAVDKCVGEGEDPEVWLPSLVGRAPREAVDDTAAVVLTLAEAR
jgi:hypothetical protein